MRLSPSERRAQRLLATEGVKAPPIPVEQLAKNLGAEIVYRAFDGDVSGMLYRGEGPPLIGIHAGHTPNRQRFTIGHEIGHLLLHRGKPVIVDRGVRVNHRDGTSDTDEMQANAFAAELLMPRDFVTKAVRRLVAKSSPPDSRSLVVRLAKTFKVSDEAMGYRLVNLGILDPGAL